jgi:hypothetical protein
MTTGLFVCFVLLLCLLIGYSTGRRIGYSRGLSEGRVRSRIELREESLRKGGCPICDCKSVN